MAEGKLGQHILLKEGREGKKVWMTGSGGTSSEKKEKKLHLVFTYPSARASSCWLYTFSL